jgi:pimeloyl-ACP methyl ester carboxylesterase
MPDQTRRDLLVNTAAAGAALSVIVEAGAACATIESRSAAIRPFRVDIPQHDIEDLRRRILATRWPERETVDDTSQGVPLTLIQDLARYWATDYDWRTCERRLNALPQFMTEIDGLDIHFIHVRSRHANALPLIVTHGWPGSVIEQLKLIDPLTNPTAHGGRGADAFDVVIPSVPGYGFSGRPDEPGWDSPRIARAWTGLMKRLGYTRFVAQGGDIGSAITQAMALQAPPELLGIHVNFPGVIPAEISAALARGDPTPPGLSAEEARAYEQIKLFRTRHFAYALMMGQRPQTLYGLADSPIALAAWTIDHGDAYDQPAASIISAIRGRTINGHPAGAVTRDDVLDDISLYWFTNTGVSASRFYWELKGMSPLNVAGVQIPTAVTAFPGELMQAPRSWAERAYPNLIYFNAPNRGGHFAAWEEPQLFTQELRAAFAPLRPRV